MQGACPSYNPSMSQAPENADLAAFDALPARWRRLADALHTVVVGQEDAVRLLQVALLCRAHVLATGVPGLAKTLLVRTLARAVGVEFARIQFTPDLMPSDILGSEILQEVHGAREMRFVPGPLFTQLLLADEINRTPPRTQSALLEAMAERQVTVAGRTRPLEDPFVVVATQNPIEQDGTWPLPEAQLDRFMLGLSMGYPTLAEEKRIAAEAPRIRAAAAHMTPVLSRAQLVRDADLVLQMPVADSVTDLAVHLVRATRPTDPGAPALVRECVAWGAGPRAAQDLIHAAQALAALEGAPTPAPRHVKALLVPVLAHRLVMGYGAQAKGVTAESLVGELAKS